MLVVQVKVSVICTPMNLVLSTTSTAKLLSHSGMRLPHSVEVVPAAPAHHLLSVCLVVLVADEAHYCCVIRVFVVMASSGPGQSRVSST